MAKADKPYSLLIIDDSEIVSQRVASLIRDHADCYEILFANNPLEAYQKLNNQNFHFVIADIHLEDQKRFDLIKYIKNLEKAPKLIVLTNQVSQQHKVSYLALGADFFIDKSVEFEKLPDILNCEIAGIY